VPFVLPERPAQGVEPYLATIMSGPCPRFAWSCRRHRCLIFLRDPSRLHDHEKSDWRAVPDQRRSRSQPDGCPGRMSPPLASTPHVCRWPGWHHYRTPWLRGRPSPTWGHARPRRDRPRWVPTRLSGGPTPQQQANHKPVASLLSVTCSYPGPGGQTSISQRAHTIGSSPTGPRTNRSAPRPLAFPTGKHAPRRSDLPRPSPTDRRDGDPEPRQPRQLAHTARQPTSCARQHGDPHVLNALVRTAPSSNRTGRKCRSFIRSASPASFFRLPTGWAPSGRRSHRS
jgi:hypothetical protein